MPALHQTRRLINAEGKLCCKNIYYCFFIPYTGMKLVSMVLKDRFAALWLLSFACTNVHWGTAIIFKFRLSYKGGGIVMACSTLKTQSFSAPLCVACSIWKLGWMNKFSAPSLYYYLFTQWWQLCCMKVFPERLPSLQLFVLYSL